MRTCLRVAAGLMLAGSVPSPSAAQSAEPQAVMAVAPDRGAPTASTRTDDVRSKMIARRIEGLGRGVEIGISIRDLEPAQMETLTGARVEDVRAGSPAEKAGLRQDDVITGFDGQRVRGARHLSRMVAETPEGRTVPVTVLREGKTVTLSVTPEPGDAVGPRAKLGPPMRHDIGPDVPGFSFDDHQRLLEKRLPDLAPRGYGAFELFRAPGQARLGVGIQDLTPQLAEYFGATGGALVASVEPDSPAARAGLKAGDVITAVNGTTVEDANDLVDEMGAVRDGAEVSIAYLRERRSATTIATLAEEQKKPQARWIVRPV